MVGTTGFEPATSRTPSVRATRLRYVPTAVLTSNRPNQRAESQSESASLRLSPPFEKRQESPQSVAQIEKHFAAEELSGPLGGGIGEQALGIGRPVLLAEVPARARDGESFIVEQALDAKDHVHVVLAIEAAATGALERLKHGKLSFPIAQHEGLQGRQPADVANAVEAFFKGGLRCCAVAWHSLETLPGRGTRIS